MSEAVLARVYVGIGCNLGDRVATINTAIAAIESLPGCANLTRSSLYETEPMGPKDQPSFINAVVGFDSDLSAQLLLEALQSIENEHGRIRTKERWGPRTLDLDVLLYADQIIETATLSVPHPGIALRSFVLVPLLEINPDCHIPGVGLAADLVADCPQYGISVYNK